MAQVISSTCTNPSTTITDFNAGKNYAVIEVDFTATSNSGEIIIQHPRSDNYFRLAQCYNIRSSGGTPVEPPTVVPITSVIPFAITGVDSRFITKVILSSLNSNDGYKLVLVLLNDE